LHLHRRATKVVPLWHMPLPSVMGPLRANPFLSARS
jgi:hypothetical protein